ncbi:penicillin-binding protein 2 [Candidatus Sumerlaeota bacterium]
MLSDLPRPKDFPIFTGRLQAIRAVVFLTVLLMLALLVWHNVVRGREYLRLSELNFLFPQEIEAPRGLITDRHGEILAYNRTSYRLLLGRFRFSKDELLGTVARLEKMLGRESPDVRQRAPRLRRYESQLIVEGLSPAEALPIQERQGELPGLIIEQTSPRYYPDGTAFSHAVGYTGMASGRNLERLRAQDYTDRDRLGKAGLEQYYEKSLRGEKGSQSIMRDARGRTRDVFDVVPAHPGDRLVTTLDADLQRLAVRLLAEYTTKSIAIMMDPNDGELLVLASHPTYDLNSPARGLNDRAQPHINRAIQEQYPPGSTWKLVTALAALDKGWDPKTKIRCNGRLYIENWTNPFLCHRSWGHGDIDLEEALKYSCNVYFYTLGRKYGGKTIFAMAGRLGLGRRTNIDLPPGEEIGGSFPDPSRPLYAGDLFQIGIGQGQITVPPLQIITAYCAVANGGRLVTPHLLRRIEDLARNQLLSYDTTPRARLGIADEHRRVVLRGLWRVINEKNGTAYWDPAKLREERYERMFPLEWDALGKTATATRGFGAGQFNDAWFVALAPRDKPRIAVLVMIERGGHGGDAAAPLVRELLKAYLEKYPGPPAPDAIEEPQVADVDGGPTGPLAEEPRLLIEAAPTSGPLAP